MSGRVVLAMNNKEPINSPKGKPSSHLSARTRSKVGCMLIDDEAEEALDYVDSSDEHSHYEEEEIDDYLRPI
jgi:hypothetical protein